MRNKILIADDDPDIVEFIQYNLEKNDYDVITASNGKEAISIAIEEKPDLILLDIMMPEADGVEVCSDLRSLPEFQDTLIVFFTARGEDYSKIAGFEVGADDYITKPIKPRILIAKINALLKRIKTKEENPIIHFNSISIDQNRRIVIVNSEEIFLPKKEFEILLLLAKKPNFVFDREKIYRAVWGTNVFVGNRTIDVHVKKIREKIGDDYIKTIKGVGYKFIPYAV